MLGAISAFVSVVLYYIGLLLVFVALFTFLLPQLLPLVRFKQNLKTKYDAEWAIVTGGSSGIGKAIAEMCADQGISVVLVSLADPLLKKTAAELRAKHPDLQFIEVGADLNQSDSTSYINAIEAAVRDLPPAQLLFSNAGYLLTGFFAEVPVERHLGAVHCNAVSAVAITHAFLARLRPTGKRGAVVFTSSPAGLMACPFSSMYGATKAFLTEFAVSIAPELRSEGIDVSVIHPSPVASNFYEADGVKHKIDAMDFFRKTATGPAVLADAIAASVGRSVVIDQGWYPITVRALLKVCDECFLAEIIARIAHTLPDYKRNAAKRAQPKQPKKAR